MPRNSPTLAEIAADFRLWGEYFDVDGHDSLEQWEAIGQRARLEMLQAAYDHSRTLPRLRRANNLHGGSCANCCGEW
jgi:hypothetical protein